MTENRRIQGRLKMKTTTTKKGKFSDSGIFERIISIYLRWRTVKER